MMGWGGGWGGGNMFGFVLIGLVLVVGAGSGGRPGEDRPLAILKERYARGEIDKTEFDTRKRDLS